MQIWQLAEKTKTRAEHFLLNAQKSRRDTHFPVSMFFFKRFSCTYQNRCRNLTTIGWSFSAQFRKKTKSFSDFFYPNCTMDTQKAILPTPLRIVRLKSEKKLLHVQCPKMWKLVFKKSLLSAEGSFGRRQFWRPCRKRTDKNSKIVTQCLKFFSKK